MATVSMWSKGSAVERVFRREEHDPKVLRARSLTKSASMHTNGSGFPHQLLDESLVINAEFDSRKCIERGLRFDATDSFDRRSA
ncbi:MAG: hypothetical protein R3E58_12730 [Phycisphaerae bacterium]